MVEWFGYWEVWHVVLATWLFLFIWRFYPYNKQRVFLWVLAIAVGWELSEIVWNQGAYSGWRHQFGNSMKDILGALLAIGVTTSITAKKRLL